MVTRKELVEALEKLQWGSCDGCKTGMQYCPACGQQRADAFDPSWMEPEWKGRYGHTADCWVGKLVAAIAATPLAEWPMIVHVGAEPTGATDVSPALRKAISVVEALGRLRLAEIVADRARDVVANARLRDASAHPLRDNVEAGRQAEAELAAALTIYDAMTGRVP